MGVFDDVLCNNDLFGDHKGETHRTQSLHPVFPGSTYEITPTGRLELLECTYEDRSDPNAPRWGRLAGMMTPVFTGQRSDVALHGWLEFPGFGRAKFTDGTLVGFEPESDQSLERNQPPTTGIQSSSVPALASSDRRGRRRTRRISAVLFFRTREVEAPVKLRPLACNRFSRREAARPNEHWRCS